MNKDLKSAVQSFERRLLFAYIAGLFILILLSLGSCYFQSQKHAAQTLNLLQRMFKVGDFREVIYTLEDARLNEFAMIGYQINKAEWSFILPSTLEFQKENVEQFRNNKWVYSEIVFEVLNGSSKNGDLVFIFNRFSQVPYAFVLWVIILLLSIPQVVFLRRRVFKNYESDLNLKNALAKADIAKQVSHDIRSPLSALTMVAGTLKEIPEEKRLLIRNATQRINDIANDLLQKGKEDTNSDSATGSNVTPATNIEFIPVIIDILVSEKRMQFREHSDLEIEVDLKDSFGSFAQINNNELKRVISNLVNNAVEAFQKHQGRITVGVRKITAANNQNVEISVKDNGRGIPKHILEKLGQMGVTHGKEGTHSGSGLGVYHAKKTVESFGGTFEIDSVEGKGTTIRIILPLAEPPTWFANKIDLTAKKYLISLDDDISIHQIWSGRLSSLGFNNIEHLRFQSGETFKLYVNSNLNKLKESIFLVDYELLKQPLTGLDIIDELGIEKYSILVTSRYEESALQGRASRLRLPILPKALAGFVPFEKQQPKEVYDLCLIEDDTQMINQPMNTNSSSMKISEEKTRYDLCLIDDDQELIGAVWAAVAAEKGLKIRLLATPQAFLAEADKIARQSPIYIDVSLGNGVSGLDVARDIHKLGFTEINLATGYDADSIVTPTFIHRVVGKDFPL